MNDKKDLTAKVELLGKQIQELEAQAQKQISDLSKRHAEQLRIEKEKWAALERVSREKWASAKEKELKELTVRGLEPELKKIMAVSTPQPSLPSPFPHDLISLPRISPERRAGSEAS